MEPRLKNILKSHYRFVNDQVLTAEKLNRLITYFDEQDRLSRVFLSGIGIVCGFEVRGSEESIFISPGIGITSDGDLIQLKSDGVTPDTVKINSPGIELTHYRQFLDVNANYNRFELEDGKISMWELLPAATEGSFPLTGEDSDQSIDLNNKVLMIYLEAYADKGDLCTAIDCDSQGEEQISRLRFLLINEDDAQHIIESDPVFQWHDIAEKYTNLPELKALRVAIGNVSNLGTLKQRFHNAVNTTVLNKLKTGFNTIFGILNVPGISSGINTQLLFTPAAFSQLPDFQYRYDLLSDLIENYNEIKQLLLSINSECEPDVSSFPKHLFLGKLFEENRYDTFRHRIYKSPLSHHETTNRAKVKSLIQRAIQLINRYSVQPGQNVSNIKITPSKSGDTSLGEKTIPYYYSINNSFLNAWSFEKTSNLKQNYNLCYYVQNLANEPEIRQPLLFSTDDFDFFRIEGHLGLNAKESRDRIIADTETYGLDFDCKVVELDSTKKSFREFSKAHPGLVHKGGVPKGGTFVIVSDNKTAVADFSLPYKIAEEKEQDCCSLMECSYPWISSLKYLNNLSRSLKGTQSRTKFMPKNYVLQVLEYKINGQSLVDISTQVSVPVQDIYKRRMHAVTEALNKRFNKGVIFDFNESQKRFLIIRAKEDRYTIRFRDITYSRTGPIYTYSNNGMFRNDLVFRAGVMRCRDLKEYNPAFYEKLHQTIAPVNKDDDYGKFYEKWGEWNGLKDKLVRNPFFVEQKLTRMITERRRLPEGILEQLNSLIIDFNELTESNLIFMLDGDWVTGEWVDESMLDYYRRNKSNTDDEIVEFIELRKLLHSETGQTKLSLYITNHEYNEVFDRVIKEYSAFADIYFGSPSGINAIQV